MAKENKPSHEEAKSQKNGISFRDWPMSGTQPKPNADYKDEANTLFEAISEKGIFNVGIIAGYGAGKSSLILSLLDRLPKHDCFPKMRFLKRHFSQSHSRTVSLLTFSAFDQSSKGLSGKEKLEWEKERKNCIENEMVKQLLFGVRKRSVPASRICRVGGVTYRFIAIWASLFLAVVSTLFALGVYFGVFQTPQLNYSESGHVSFLVSSMTAAVSLLTSALFGSLSFGIKKLSFSAKGISGETEASQSEDLIDKYYNELVYFFSETAINLVVFEDLDRFESKEILEDLRALNFGLNKAPSIQKRGGIIFVYCVSDSLSLGGTDKAKFFDFALPMVPVVNPYNSAEEIFASPIMEDGHVKPSDDAVMALSAFIHDKRVITEIISDYGFYLKSNEEEFKDEEDANALLSLVFYKHISPKGFSDFQSGEKNALKDALQGKELTNTDVIQKEFIIAIVDLRYVSKNCLKYVSSFDQTVFKGRTDKDLYERISKDDGYWKPQTRLSDPTNVLAKTPAEYLKRDAALNYDLLRAIMACQVSENPIEKKKYEAFINSFAELSEVRKNFINGLLSCSDEAFSKFLVAVATVTPGFFQFVFSTDIKAKNPRMIAYFVGKTVFKSKENISYAMYSGYSDPIVQYIASMTAPSKGFEFADYLTVEHFAGQWNGCKIKSLTEVGATQFDDLVINTSLFEPTVENVLSILRGRYGAKERNNALFTDVFATGNEKLIKYICFGSFDKIVAAWLASGKDFSGETPETIERIIRETGYRQEKLKDFLISCSVTYKKRYADVQSFIPVEKIRTIISSGILVTNMDDMAQIYKEHPDSIAVITDFISKNSSAVPDHFEITEEIAKLLKATLHFSASENRDGLSEIFEKSNLEPEKAVNPYESEVNYVLCKSGKVEYSVSNTQVLSHNEICFEFYAKTFASKIVNDSTTFSLNDNEAEKLLSFCETDKDKKTIFKKYQSRFIETMKTIHAEKLIDNDFVAKTTDVLNALMNLPNTDYDCMISILNNSKEFIDPNFLFHWLTMRNNDFKKLSQSDISLIKTKKDNPIRDLFDILCNYSILQKSEESGRLSYSLGPRCPKNILNQ